MVGSLFLCLDGPGEITIGDVDLVEADRGMRLTGFAVRPHPILRGGQVTAMAPRSLEQVGLAGDGPHVVDIECQRNSGRGYELVVEVVRTVPTQVGAQALSVTYHNEHEAGRCRWACESAWAGTRTGRSAAPPCAAGIDAGDSGVDEA